MMAMNKNMIQNKYSSVDEFILHERGKHICECGCGAKIDIKKSHYWNGIPRFLFGHAARLRAGPIPYDDSLYYSVSDIADKAKVSNQTVRLWNRAGKIKASMVIGRKKLYLKREIDRFLKSRPEKKMYDPKDYISFDELKKRGVSRRKLRRMVRRGNISEPKHFGRKTNYLRTEIDQYLNEIMEDPISTHRKSYASRESLRKLRKRVDDLERRIAMLEKK